MSGSGNVVAAGGGQPRSAMLLGVTAKAPLPVNGFDVPPSYLAVLLGLMGPWTIVAATCVTIVAVVEESQKALRRLKKA